jgi:hypothetical protein
MANKFIMKTDYFTDPWTWLKRLLEFGIALLFLFWVTTQEPEQGTSYFWVKYLLFGLITIFIFVRPKDELALDIDNLYYIKKSLIPFMSKTNEYKISKIKSIGYRGVFSGKTEILGLLGSGTNRNRLEIIFKDNSSRSHDLTIYKDELVTIVSKVKELINKNRA